MEDKKIEGNKEERVEGVEEWKEEIKEGGELKRTKKEGARTATLLSVGTLD